MIFYTEKKYVNASLKCKGEGQGVAATLLINHVLQQMSVTVKAATF